MNIEVNCLELANIKAELIESYMQLRRVIVFDGSPQARGLNKIDAAIEKIRNMIDEAAKK